MTCTFEARSMSPGRQLIGRCNALCYLQSSLRGMRIHKRENKTSIVYVSIESWPTTASVRSQSALLDAAVSMILARAYDRFRNLRLACQRGNCAGKSDHHCT